ESRQLVSSNYVNGRLVGYISNPSIDARLETGSERRTTTAWQAQDQIFQAYRPIFVRHSTGGTDDSPTFVTTVFDWGDPYAKGRTPSVTACYSGTYTNPDVAAVWQNDPSDPDGSYPYVVAVNKVNGSWSNQTTLTTNGRFCTSAQGGASQSTGGAMAAWSSASGTPYTITANQGTNGTLSKVSPPRMGRAVDLDLATLGVEGLAGTVSLYVEESGTVKFQPLSALAAPAREFLSAEVQSSQATSVPYRLSLLNLRLPTSGTAAPGDLIAFTAEKAASDGSYRPTNTITLQALLALWAKRTRVDSTNKIAETVGSFTGLSTGAFRIVASLAERGSGDEPRLYEFVLPSDSSALQKQLAQEQPTPGSFGLEAAYPNPFNPATSIRFGLPSDAHVKLAVYDLLGREVARLAEGFHQAGYHTVTWNAQNAASGLYFARLTVTNELGKVVYSRTSKLLLTR
ncbi:MAG TPA: T9SS type A sorting domain-containing protein, partial [Chloroflexota bacterium]